MADHPKVPDAVLARLRLVCLDLPEAYEEAAWVGTRWCVRKKNFAQVLMIDAGWPPAYARAAGLAGPACVLTFRLPRAKVDALRTASRTLLRPPWFRNIAGLVIDDDVDWDDVDSLLTQSYCTLAPKKLAARVDSPDRA